MAITAFSSVSCIVKCDEVEALASLARLVTDRDSESSILAADTIVTKMAKVPHIIARCSIIAQIKFQTGKDAAL